LPTSDLDDPVLKAKGFERGVAIGWRERGLDGKMVLRGKEKEKEEHTNVYSILVSSLSKIAFEL
jgi:hypothetical protein